MNACCDEVKQKSSCKVIYWGHFKNCSVTCNVMISSSWCTLDVCVVAFRKDAEIGNVNSKLESEQALVAQLQKKIKELQASIA